MHTTPFFRPILRSQPFLTKFRHGLTRGSKNLLAAAILMTLSSAALAQVASETQALQALANWTRMDRWNRNDNWVFTRDPSLQPPPCGSLFPFYKPFYGITCGEDPVTKVTTITEIRLPRNNLDGLLPKLLLQQFPNLQVFDVSGNGLLGAVPNLAGLQYLTYFNVSSNYLVFSLPPLTGLKELVVFDVSSNQIGGTLPSLSGLESLGYFNVSFNRITGSIPALADVATTLHVFSAAHNQLTGSIPAFSPTPRPIGCCQLEVLDVSDNLLSGPIPSFEDVFRLKAFGAANNSLDGPLPKLPLRLEWLNIANNQLDSKLPDAPKALIPGGTQLCKNRFLKEDSPDWDKATGKTPWHQDC